MSGVYPCATNNPKAATENLAPGLATDDSDLNQQPKGLRRGAATGPCRRRRRHRRCSQTAPAKIDAGGLVPASWAAEDCGFWRAKGGNSFVSVGAGSKALLGFAFDMLLCAS